jgi:hypothetical protein
MSAWSCATNTLTHKTHCYCLLAAGDLLFVMVPCTQISLQPLEVFRLPPLAKHKVEECGDTMRSKYWHILLSMHDTYPLCDIGMIALCASSVLAALSARF